MHAAAVRQAERDEETCEIPALHVDLLSQTCVTITRGWSRLSTETKFEKVFCASCSPLKSDGDRDRCADAAGLFFYPRHCKNREIQSHSQPPNAIDLII